MEIDFGAALSSTSCHYLKELNIEQRMIKLMTSLGHNLKENFIGPIIDRNSKVNYDIFGNE